MRISLHESNDEKEFRKLYEEYYAPFCIYAKRFINDMAICEDIVSDVFASLWDKRNSIELKKDTATAYLKICVRNSCLNYLKHLEYEWNYNELCQKQPPVYATESDSVYTLNELYDMLFKALERLPQNSCGNSGRIKPKRKINQPIQTKNNGYAQKRVQRIPARIAIPHRRTKRNAVYYIKMATNHIFNSL